MSTPIVPPFTVAHGEYEGEGYVCTNECLQTLRELVSDQTFGRSASIASGGEIPFFVLSPKATKVECIDHTSRPIAACYVKLLLLQTLGAEGMSKLLRGTYGDFVDAAKKVFSLVPDPLKNHLETIIRGSYELRAIRSYDWESIRKYWNRLPLTALQAAIDNMHKLSFTHGDLTDLPKGVFEMSYLSNALGHLPRPACRYKDTFHLPKDNVEALATEGGKFLCTVAGDYKNTAGVSEVWIVGKVIKRKTASALGGDWVHFLTEKGATNEHLQN